MSVKREITDLTACRAIFAAWVFTYHVDLHANFSAYLGPAAGLIRRGYLGVDGFFLLSGYILARVHPELAHSPAGAPNFWIKRLARIYPVHLAVLIMLAAIAAAGFALGIVPHDPGRFSPAALLQDLLLIQAWGLANQLAWNYPSWSISTEWAGYLMFPLLCYALQRCSRTLAIMLLAGCAFALTLVEHRSAHGLNLTFADSLWRFFPEFIAGMIISRLTPAATALRVEPSIAIPVAIVIIALLFTSDRMVVAGLWLLILVLVSRADSGAAPALWNLKPLQFMGALSYAFYMSFATIELILAQLCGHEGWNPAGHKLIYALAMTSLTFVLALTLHYGVEKPGRQRIDARLQAPFTSANPAVSNTGDTKK